jgi:hypothetical protein
MRAYAGNIGQYMGSEHERAGDNAPGKSCQAGPLERAEEAKSWAFRLAVDGIRFDEQPYPRAVKNGIDDAKNESVKDEPHQRSKQVGRRIHRPVQWHPLRKGKEREWPGEPATHGVTETPTHTGSVTANVALKEQPEGGITGWQRLNLRVLQELLFEQSGSCVVRSSHAGDS